MSIIQRHTQEKGSSLLPSPFDSNSRFGDRQEPGGMRPQYMHPGLQRLELIHITSQSAG